MRVLQVIGSLESGGSQAMIMNLYRNIDRNRIQFDFMIFHRGGVYEKEIRELGGKVYYIEAFNGKNLVNFINAWKTFLMEHPEYKIIHGHVRSVAAIYLYIAKRRGRIVIAHSHNTSNGTGGVAVVKNMMQLPIRYVADYMFACSTEAGKWLYGRKACQKKSFYILKNGIDIKKYEFQADIREEYRRQMNLDDCFVMGHVGRFHPQKNHEFLLRVFREVRKEKKNAVLLLVGDGELREKIEQSIQELDLGESVKILGNRKDVAELSWTMDVFVFPSLHEGLPVSVIEAQAAGLPCLVSKEVSQEVEVTEQIFWLPISEGIKIWKDKLINLQLPDREKSHTGKLCEAGYDVKKSAERLEQFYVRISGSCEKK